MKKGLHYDFTNGCPHPDPVEGAGIPYEPPPSSPERSDVGESDRSAGSGGSRSAKEASGLYVPVERRSNRWMELACEEAVRSVRCGGGPFGSVIVQVDDETGEVLRYWVNQNYVTRWNDPTAHAEITAIRTVCKSLGVFDLGTIRREESSLPQKGATSHCEIYSSAEPCPMCYSAIVWARIPALYFAATRFHLSEPGLEFSDEAIYEELERPYTGRRMRVGHCRTERWREALELWKSSEKIPY